MAVLPGPVFLSLELKSLEHWVMSVCGARAAPDCVGGDHKVGTTGATLSSSAQFIAAHTNSYFFIAIHGCQYSRQ